MLLGGIFIIRPKKIINLSVSMRLTNEYLTWERGSVAGLPFTAKVRINYPEQTITYRPGFWQVIKSLVVITMNVMMIENVKSKSC